MNPQRISELLARRSELKAKGEYQAAIPLQLEILERLSKTEASPERMASAHNYASVLYSGVRSYAMAETHARLALDYPLGDSHKAHESRATYLFVLARILAA